MTHPAAISDVVIAAKQGPKWIALDFDAASAIHFMPPTPPKMIVRNEKTDEFMRVMRRRRIGNRVRLYCARNH
jgi:hypothetical protein